MIAIESFEERDRDEVVQLVLRCQNDGSRPYVDVSDQPDLLRIRDAYMLNGGNFWVARENGKVVGSIGLMKYESGLGILKKFFVHEAYRGAPHHLGQRLHGVLLDFAQEQGIKMLILDTPKNTERAHRFYEKAGYRQIQQEELPVAYDYPYRESDFFLLDLE